MNNFNFPLHIFQVSYNDHTSCSSPEEGFEQTLEDQRRKKAASWRNQKMLEKQSGEGPGQDKQGYRG